jgi:hypothetical protein
MKQRISGLFWIVFTKKKFPLKCLTPSHFQEERKKEACMGLYKYELETGQRAFIQFMLFVICRGDFVRKVSLFWVLGECSE